MYDRPRKSHLVTADAVHALQERASREPDNEVSALCNVVKHESQFSPAGSLSGVVLCGFFRGLVFLGLGKNFYWQGFWITCVVTLFMVMVAW